MSDCSADSQNDETFIWRFTASQRALRAYIVSLTPTRSDADDVLQEVNLAMWRKRDGYDPSQDFLRWAFGFALVEIRSFRSRAANSRVWFNNEVTELLAVSCPGNVRADELQRDALVSCLNRLAEQDRSVVAAFYSHRVSARELAEQLQRPLSSVYKTLNRARESLRMCVRYTLAQMEHPPSD